MASEVIWEHLIYKIFLGGGACPQTPLVNACLHTHTSSISHHTVSSIPTPSTWQLWIMGLHRLRSCNCKWVWFTWGNLECSFTAPSSSLSSTVKGWYYIYLQCSQHIPLSRDKQWLWILVFSLNNQPRALMCWWQGCTQYKKKWEMSCWFPNFSLFSSVTLLIMSIPLKSKVTSWCPFSSFQFTISTTTLPWTKLKRNL